MGIDAKLRKDIRVWDLFHFIECVYLLIQMHKSKAGKNTNCVTSTTGRDLDNVWVFKARPLAGAAAGGGLLSKGSGGC